MRKQPITTTQVSYRLPTDLVERMRDISAMDGWPPPPSQTEIVVRGIEIVLEKLRHQKRGRRTRYLESIR